MRNTPILIPIILVVCLGTLTYLLYAALTASNPGASNVRMAQTDAIAQNQLRTAPPPPERSMSAAPDRSAAGEPDLDRYYQDVPEDQSSAARAPYDRGEDSYAEDEDVELSGMDNEVTRQVIADRNGAYTVLAGSFRQLLNAEGQVKKLKKAGFAESKVAKSTGGAYAMAVVGRRASRGEADILLAEVKRKGFEARVVKR